MNCKCRKEDLLLYAVTDRSWLRGRQLWEQVEEALRGGVTMVQLREKNLPEREFLEEAVRIRKLCRAYHVPFIVNDNVEIARLCGADGVHTGQDDMEVSAVRAILGPDKIIGVSAKTVEQAVHAWKHGADYLGTGAVFPTGTKADATGISREQLRAVCAAVPLPVAAIGGITKENLSGLSGTGISGIAVVSALFARPDTRQAAAELRAAVERDILHKNRAADQA